MTERRTIAIDALARVEGEGALHLVAEGGTVREVRLSIYEPPRLFEAFLRGRSHRELPDLVARCLRLGPIAPRGPVPESACMRSVARGLLGGPSSRTNGRPNAAAQEDTMSERIRDWMTPKPASIGEDHSLLEAHDLMVERGIRHLPVVDPRNHVIGIVTIDDLRAAVPFAVSRNRSVDLLDRGQVFGMRVSDAMTWAPHTAHPETSLEDAVAQLCDNRIGCLPVVDARDELVGILSETDALRALRRLLDRGGDSDGPRAGEPEGIVDALWAERERLVEQIARWEQTERALLDEIREPSDSVDRAADERAVAGIELLSTRAKRRLAAIELALERAEHGALGICERCHGRIPPPRLRAVPEATLCVRCAATAVS